MFDSSVFFFLSFPFCNFSSFALLYITGERQAHINIADGKKIYVTLASEAAKTNQVNRAYGKCWDCESPCPTLYYLVPYCPHISLFTLDISLYIRHSFSNSPSPV